MQINIGALQGTENYVDLFLFSLCSLCECCEPNLQGKLTIAQGTCTLNFLLLSAPFLLLGCSNVKIMNIIYDNLFIFQGLFQGKIGFKEMKFLFLKALFTAI